MIICDPSCSGSGMRLHGQEKQECTLKHKTPEDQMQRVLNLSKFQFKILAHALNYSPTVKYVSYSTCSIYKEEDEQIVGDVLKKFGDEWEVCPNMQEIVWKTFLPPKGSEEKNEAEKYKKGIHFTKSGGVKFCPKCSHSRLSGFFCALFKRKN